MAVKLLMKNGSYHCNLYLPNPLCIDMDHLLGAASLRRLPGNRTLEKTIGDRPPTCARLVTYEEANSLSHPSLEGIYTVHRIRRSDQIVRR